MLTEKLVLSILTNKAADSKELFEAIVSQKVEEMASRIEKDSAYLMLDEETKTAVDFFDDMHGYFNEQVEAGRSVEDVLTEMSESEEIGPELTEKFMTMLEAYLESEGDPEDPEEEEDDEEEEAEEDDAKAEA